MDASTHATKVVDEMYNNDPFCKWMGIERVEESAGRSVLQLRVREEMVNGLKIAHGGVTYSLADSALAFASNSYGRKAVSLETSISHVAPCMIGDVLTAVAEEVNRKNKIAVKADADSKNGMQ